MIDDSISCLPFKMRYATVILTSRARSYALTELHMRKLLFFQILSNVTDTV